MHESVNAFKRFSFKFMEAIHMQLRNLPLLSVYVPFRSW